jgi:hypothetical protein
MIPTSWADDARQEAARFMAVGPPHDGFSLNDEEFTQNGPFAIPRLALTDVSRRRSKCPAQLNFVGPSGVTAGR